MLLYQISLAIIWFLILLPPFVTVYKETGKWYSVGVIWFISAAMALPFLLVGSTL